MPKRYIRVNQPHPTLSNLGAALAEQLEQTESLLVGALHAFLEAARVRHGAEDLEAAVRVLVYCYYVRSRKGKWLHPEGHGQIKRRLVKIGKRNRFC